MKKVIIILISLILVDGRFSYAQNSFKVEVAGKGDPILLFPGFTCPGEVWDETLTVLSKENECHVFTFAGFGDVQPIEMPWFSTIKSEIIEYVKTKGLKKPLILGHSLGGTLGLWLASEEPDLFKKVIVVDGLPGAIALMNPNHKKGDIIPYNSPQSLAQLQMSEEDFTKMANQMASFMSLNKSKQATIAQWMKQTDRKTFVNAYVDYLNTDLREDIAKIRIPVVVLAATFPDKATVKMNYDKQFEKLPGVKFEYADNSGHFVMFDQPEWFITKLMENK